MVTVAVPMVCGVATRATPRGLAVVMAVPVVANVAFPHVELAGLVMVVSGHGRPLFGQLLSSRSTAAVASVNFRSASGPPAATASATQWRR
jgi:hypothetical protein